MAESANALCEWYQPGWTDVNEPAAVARRMVIELVDLDKARGNRLAAR
jgi:hypothetical protein